MSQPYVMTWQPQVFQHFPATLAMLHDGSEIDHHELNVRVRSGEYFASLAMLLENIADDPNMDMETCKYMLQKFSEELLYLQDAYKIAKR